MTRPSPYLKWAGGKTQLLGVLEKFYPPKFNSYYEPFLGGGAVFFHLCALGRIRQAKISDSNIALMNSYVAIRNNLGKLVDRLQALQGQVSSKSYYYDYARPRFNGLRLSTGLEGDDEKAALLIYLNKTCYNGLFRVNRKGDFNVPWGKYKNARIYDEDTLRAVHGCLSKSGISLQCSSYKESLTSAEEGDFVYLDPPYQPLSSTSSFTDYTSKGFTLSDQKGLANTVAELDARGCFVMISNSAHAHVRKFYEKIGSKGHFETVYASRAISSVGTGRGKIAEYLITNYKVN